MKRRGYSKDFTPHADTGKRYLLDAIPAGLWTQVRQRARRDGVSLRGLILKLLAEWLASGAPAAAPLTAADVDRLIEAIDSHCYWQLADANNRRDAGVIKDTKDMQPFRELADRLAAMK